MTWKFKSWIKILLWNEMFLIWFLNSMQEEEDWTSSMFTDSKQVKMMHYWQSSYGMLHSWQKNATNEQKNVMCYPQNCVIHTLPPLLFILCAKHTKPHHPQNDKQNLESTNFLEALVKFDESCKKVNVAYWGKMGVYLHTEYTYTEEQRGLSFSLLLQCVLTTLLCLRVRK